MFIWISCIFICIAIFIYKKYLEHGNKIEFVLFIISSFIAATFIYIKITEITNYKIFFLFLFILPIILGDRLLKTYKRKLIEEKNRTEGM